MVTQKLLAYIKRCLQHGIAKEKIENSLKKTGWTNQDIKKGWDLIIPPDPLESPVLPDHPNLNTFSLEKPGKPSKALLGLIVFITSLAVISSGTFAYFYYFKSPERIMQKMITRLIDVKSLEYSIKFEMEGLSNISKDLFKNHNDILPTTPPTPNKKSDNIVMNLDGAIDMNNPSNPKNSLSLKIKTNILPLSQELSTFKIQLKIINKIIYIKLDKIPKLGFLDLSTVKDQWIKIDIEALRKQFGLDKLIKELEAQNKLNISETELSPEQIEKLTLIFKEPGTLKTEKLATEKINGINNYHYKLIINKEGIKILVPKIIEIFQDRTSKKPKLKKELETKNLPTGLKIDELNQLDLNKFYEEIDAVELPKIEIWINKKDLLPSKILIASTVKDSNQTKILGKINITMLFRNFDKPIKIEVPQKIKTLEEILDSLLGGLPGSTSINPPDNPNTKIQVLPDGPTTR